MLDKQGRIIIPKEFKVSDSEQGDVFFYYSIEEKLFYIRFEKVSSEFLVEVRKMDIKNRCFIPKRIMEIYKTKDILVAEKDAKVYLIPLKKE